VSSKKVAIVVLFGVFFGSIATADPLAAKIDVLKLANQTVTELVDLSDRCRKHECERSGTLDQEKIRHVVASILVNIKVPRALFQIAIVSYASAYPQTAGMQRVDLVFDNAWMESVRKLQSLHSTESLEALESLKSVLNLDGGNLLMTDDAIKEVKRNLPPARKQ
jgi:hypothetical protein